MAMEPHATWARIDAYVSKDDAFGRKWLKGVLALENIVHEGHLDASQLSEATHKRAHKLIALSTLIGNATQADAAGALNLLSLFTELCLVRTRTGEGCVLKNFCEPQRKRLTQVQLAAAAVTSSDEE